VDRKALFLRRFWRAPRQIGAALPSSRALADAMIAPLDFTRISTIVEFGPGTGAITEAIRHKLTPQSRYLGIELDAEFCAVLRERFPELKFVEGSVGDLETILSAEKIEQVDAIVCGLPWSVLPVELQDRVFGAMDRCLSPGARFITFAYLQGLALPAAWELRRRLGRHFDHVGRTPVIWSNVPPAFAYVCGKAGR
jgi:phospholipid N-methyltransferase